MIYFSPRFLYSGSKKWGIPSDRIFIEGKLQRLNPENQRIATEQYEDIYRFHFNRGEYSLARDSANRILTRFVNDYGITLTQFQNLQAANDDADWIESEIEKLKRLQRVARPRIDLGDKKYA